MHDPRAPRPQPDLAAIFPGDGEMAQRMRAFDWSRTPLGPVEGWPQSLRTSVSILLKSRHPMFLWWGPGLVQLYNDGYRPSLGAHKHPQALGQRGRECWEEIWPIIGPQIEGVMERGEETWHEDQLVPFDRNGFLEEIYFTYSYSPIADESGDVGGTLVVCSETTQRVLGERRLRVLRDLSAAASAAREVRDACDAALGVIAEHPRDLPFALLYLVTSDGGAARLAGVAGVEAGGELAPRRIDLETADGPWPLGEVLRARRAIVVENLGARFAEVPARPWPERPQAAVALPVAAPGHDEAVGVLVAAASPRLALDEGYRDFLELVTAQVASCLANARAYEEERRRAEALAELDRAKTAFFSNVSHEFRTPLTLILGPLEEALARGERRLEGEALATVHRNSLRLLRLVNQLLDFSRIEAGRFEARYEPLDLAELTAELASTFRSLAESAGLRLVVDCPPLAETVYVDREAWEKVVLNLLSNAFKFTFEGEIGVRLRGRGESVELTVWDTGTGIPERELPHVFERFHRVRDARSRTHEGSGIGLSLVRELVHRHGGAIEVESAEGEGASFRVTLPVGAAHLPPEQVETGRGAARDPAESALPFVEEARRWLPDAEPALAAGDLVEAERRAAGETGTARLLLADDNRDLRAYLARLLGEIWRVEAVPDGAAALERVRSDAFDLVIADVMMPRMDGFELLEKMRSDPMTASVPVILLSARAGEEARVEGLEAGADDYVVKPFTARELVARIRSQLTMARLRASADAARHELHELFLSAPAAISILRGPELRIEFVNEMYHRVVGRRELVGRPLREAFPELEGQAVFELFEGVMATGEPYVGREMPVDLERGSEGPERAYFTYVLQPIRGGDGTIEGVASFGFEVTELVEARRHMEHLAERAQVETRRKDEFLAMLGHELRNPLAPIQNAVALLKAEPGELEEKDLRWALEVIDRQLAQMSRLVDDLLDVARITRGAVRLRKRAVALDAIVSDAVEGVQALYDERGLELEVELPADPIWLEADPLRLAQVISNLLNNAAKYSEAGGRVRLVAACAEGRCTLEVADEGIGIDPETLPYVFDLFAQADRSLDRASGGLGIGLTVVQRLVELHGGRVEAHSEGVGKGSRFVVELPAAEAPETAEAPTAPDAEELAPGRRVLVVDDNRDAAESLAMLLELLGHEVRTALDGEAALEAARKLRPEVVLLDIGLPKMDGFEVARRLRAEHGLGPRIVALTGYGRSADRKRSREAGFDDHLLKPADVEEVKRLLAEPRPAERL